MARSAGSNAKPRHFLRFIQRSCQPFLANTGSQKAGGSSATDPSGPRLRDLHIELFRPIRANPRGRGKHNFGTWQGRLPQELRLRGITTVGHADLSLRERYTTELNRKFRVAAAQPESAFIPASGKDLERIFAWRSAW